jgi:hypothetical protein
MRATVLVLATLIGGSGAAAAQPYPPITDRDYTLDLYSGAIVGGVRVVGMGGAAVAVAEGSIGTLSNAAAPAVRRPTRQARFGWDFHVDGQSAAFADDFDNNGLRDTDQASSQLASIGLVLQLGRWGLGVSATTTSTRIVEDDGDAATMDGVLEPQGSVARVVVARSFAGEVHTVGGGLRFGSLSLVRPRPGLDDLALFAVSGPSLEVGWLWRPRDRRWRAGADVALPVDGHADIRVDDCDPLDCEGYILPERVAVPWTIATGLAFRFAESPWNTRVEAEHRDERSLLIAADLVVHGRVPDGHGVEAFARHLLQPSGRRTVASPRLGAEAEVIPGRIRIRVGSYWEPGRFDDVGGRLHGTGGADLRLFAVRLLGTSYRPQISLTADRAAGYGNAGISLGLWK